MLILSSAKISDKHQQRLQSTFSQHSFSFYEKHDEISDDDLNQVEIFITYGEDITIQLLDRMPNLKWIQVISAGIELIPLQELASKQILMTNARGIHRIPMAEYTIGMMLSLARSNYTFYANQQQSLWDRSPRIQEIHKQTLGILGLGAIGTEIAKRAKAFGMRVVGLKRDTSTGVEFVDQLYAPEEMKDLLAESDFVVAVLPHTKETEELFDEQAFKAMKQTAYFINIGRGSLVKDEALIHALENEQIAGAVLDVYREEPLPAEHPFWKTKNLILTPHVSGRSPFYMTRALEIFEHNLKQYPNEQAMINVIPLTRGY